MVARARNIKPSFFSNDKLAELSPLTRILFIGLWTIADREGRLEDRPKRIKAELLPYDNGNIDKMLDSLSPEFITRYEVCGNRFIQVNNFLKHQNPHKKESESTIPAPCKHGDNTKQVTEQTGTSPADSLDLIPDSPFLIPSHPNPGPGLSVAEAPDEQTAARVQNCMSEYQKATGSTSRASAELIRVWVGSMGMDPDLVLMALSNAHDKGAGNPAKYALPALQEWHKKGVKTYADYLAKIAPKPSKGKVQKQYDDSNLPLGEIEEMIRKGEFM